MFLGGAVPARYMAQCIYVHGEDGIVDGKDQLDAGQREEKGESHDGVHMHLICYAVITGVNWGTGSHV